MSLFNELKRRTVFRVGLFYIVSAWLVVQVAETVLPMFDVPDSALRAIVIILALGFPLAVVFSWVFEMTPEGLKREQDVHVDPGTKQQTAHKLNWLNARLPIRISAWRSIRPTGASTVFRHSATRSVPATSKATESQIYTKRNKNMTHTTTDESRRFGLNLV